MRQQQRQQLGAFIEHTQHGKTRKRTSLELGPPDPQRHFTPQRHGLSPEQCRIANALLRKAEQERPLHGTAQQQRFKFALRCGGIISAVKRNRVGNSRFGHHLMGFRGGRVMQRHGMHILRQWSPIASLAARLAYERRLAAEYWEQTGQVLAPGEKPVRSPEEQRIRDMINLWEESEWRTQRDRLPW